MPYAYADKVTPSVLSPESLDWYLGQGWYRMGDSMFTTHFLFFGGVPYSAIWIRQSLAGFGFSKSQRKLMRKNAKLFRVAVGPRVIDEERNELFRRYADDFDGQLSHSIAESMQDFMDPPALFNTYEVTVRDRVSGQLVAVSYFDLGERTAASILGIYDPLLKTFSLGYYTMLLEMEFCLSQGMEHYYPGYVVPDYGRFDYKLRLGPSEYYDVRTESWLPYDGADIARNGPVQSQLHHLRALLHTLAPASAPEKAILIYPLFEAGLYNLPEGEYLPYPYFLPLRVMNAHRLQIIVFDPHEQAYFVLLVRHAMAAQQAFNPNYLNSFDADRYFCSLMAVEETLTRAASPPALLMAVRQLATDEPI